MFKICAFFLYVNKYTHTTYQVPDSVYLTRDIVMNSALIKLGYPLNDLFWLFKDLDLITVNIINYFSQYIIYLKCAT